MASLRFALRRLAREPGLATTAILTLGIGIGACTAMFSALEAVLLDSMGVAAPDRVAVIWPHFGDTAGEFSYNTYLSLQKETTAFHSLAITGSTTWPAEIVTDGGTALPVARCAASANFFDLLGARPVVGRTFRPEDDARGAAPVAVLSWALWQKRFGGDPGIVGKTFRQRDNGDQTIEIIGIMPPDFFYPVGTDYWTPALPAVVYALTAADPSPQAIAAGLETLGVFHAIGRLNGRESVLTAQDEVSRLWRVGIVKAGIEPAAFNPARDRVVAEPFLDHVFGKAHKALIILMGAVSLVLIIACANVAGLLIAKGAVRSREIAVRLALGATWSRIARQFVLDAAVLAVIGAALGISLAMIGLRAIIATMPMSIPRLQSASVNAPVLAAAVLITILTTAIVGLAPTLQFRRRHLESMVRGMQGATGTVTGSLRSGFRNTLVMAQLAIALLLLVASGLAVQTFWRLSRLDLGFNPAHVLTFGVRGLDERRYPTHARRHDTVDRLVARFERLPQVRSAAAVLLRPYSHGVIGWDTGLLLEGQPDVPATRLRNPTANWETVTPRYFAAMGIRVLRGRAFTTDDRADAPLVAIVSEKLAAQAWPGQDPLGKHLNDSFAPPPDKSQPPRWLTVVGVVATARYREIERPWADLYVPLAQSGDYDPESFVIRTTAEPRAVLPAIVHELAEFDNGLSVDAPTTMDEIVRNVQAPWHFNMILFALFATISIGLTAVGVFGLVACTVAWRRREIGIRMALGARRRNVVATIVLEGASTVVLGTAIGLVVSVWATRLMRSFLFDISPTDPATLAGACGAVIALGGVACYVPARRAALLDPCIVFRDE